MTMDINELIEQLEDLRDQCAELGITPEVQIATQPNYPLSSGVDAVTYYKGTVYIAAEDGNEYAPSEAWNGGFVNEMNVEGEDDE